MTKLAGKTTRLRRSIQVAISCGVMVVKPCETGGEGGRMPSLRAMLCALKPPPPADTGMGTTMSWQSAPPSGPDELTEPAGTVELSVYVDANGSRMDSSEPTLSVLLVPCGANTVVSEGLKPLLMRATSAYLRIRRTKKGESALICPVKG